MKKLSAEAESVVFAIIPNVAESHHPASPPDVEPADEDDFMLDFGLQRILDGVERLIESREAQRRDPDRR